MFKCKYCGREFEKKQQLAGHIIWCKENPNRSGKCNFNKSEKRITKNNKQYICKYCGKIVGNNGCLVLHERACENNPNKIISKTKLKRLSKSNKKFKHSEETKLLISQKRKEWLNVNKDLHPWKRKDKFKSVPCEKFKEFLTLKGISFVDEYTPFSDVNYSIDIAFPDIQVGIEINGNQHYDADGNLKTYYNNRHNDIVSRGWKLYEIHYSLCFNLTDDKFEEILKLDIYNKDYKEYIKNNINRKNKNKIKAEKINQELINKKNNLISKRKNILIKLFNESNIDFKKYGWAGKAYRWLEKENLLFDTNILRSIRNYYPEAIDIYNVFCRKGSICTSNT